MPRVELTPEQLAIQRARQLKREEKRNQAANTTLQPKLPSCVSRRSWVQLPSRPQSNIRVSWKIMTWNILAQTLVRRELFPTSDCLKSSERTPHIIQALVDSDSDLICLQEADQLEKILPPLQSNYDHVYARGEKKKHGCLILYRRHLFSKVGEKTIHYDKEPARSGPDSRISSTRITRNIGLCVALRSQSNPSLGCIVATTHLFWHPKYTYERTRQCAIFLRAIEAFQVEHKIKDWPCYIAGDFNCAPSESSYSFLTGATVTPEQRDSLAASRVIHESLLTPSKADIDEAGDGEGPDPDRELTNATTATAGDGLLTDEEFENTFSMLAGLRSAYSVGQRVMKQPADPSVVGSRLKDFPPEHSAVFEPIWTSYTSFWRSTIDYIFILDPSSGVTSVVQGFLDSPDPATLEPGLPKKDACPSDHLPLIAQIGIHSPSDSSV